MNTALGKKLVAIRQRAIKKRHAIAIRARSTKIGVYAGMPCLPFVPHRANDGVKA